MEDVAEERAYIIKLLSTRKQNSLRTIITVRDLLETRPFAEPLLSQVSPPGINITVYGQGSVTVPGNETRRKIVP